MRAGRLLLVLLASSALSSSSLAADWYTGAPSDQSSPAQGSYISFFDSAPPPTYTKSAPVTSNESYAPAKFAHVVGTYSLPKHDTTSRPQ